MKTSRKAKNDNLTKEKNNDLNKEKMTTSIKRKLMTLTKQKLTTSILIRSYHDLDLNRIRSIYSCSISKRSK